jgi:hypothetical protein
MNRPSLLEKQSCKKRELVETIVVRASAKKNHRDQGHSPWALPLLDQNPGGCRRCQTKEIPFDLFVCLFVCFLRIGLLVVIINITDLLSRRDCSSFQ